jgi:hypothetical protein
VWSAWGATRVDGRTPDFWHTGAAPARSSSKGVLERVVRAGRGGFRARHRAVDRTVRPP